MVQRFLLSMKILLSCVVVVGMDADKRAHLERVVKLPDFAATTLRPLSSMVTQPGEKTGVSFENCRFIVAAEALCLLIEDDRKRNRSAIEMFEQAGSGEA